MEGIEGMGNLMKVVDMAKGIVCPYDNSHVVTYESLYRHVDKCRNNYRQQRLARGEELVFLTCKYNVRHQVDGPELLFHEARCDDRNKTPAYLMPADYPGLELTPGEVETVEKKMKEEEKTLYEGLAVGSVIGTVDWGRPQSIFAMRYPKTAAKEMAQKKAKAKEEEEAKRLSEAAKVENQRGGQGEEEEEEDWSKDCNAPPFYYLESVMNPTKPTWKIPPGLTKSQRKEFVKWHVQWVENIAEREKKRQEEEKEGENEGGTPQGVQEDDAPLGQENQSSYPDDDNDDDEGEEPEGAAGGF